MWRRYDVADVGHDAAIWRGELVGPDLALRQ
jgi:hypothetical protein